MQGNAENACTNRMCQCTFKPVGTCSSPPSLTRFLAGLLVPLVLLKRNKDFNLSNWVVLFIGRCWLLLLFFWGQAVVSKVWLVFKTNKTCHGYTLNKKRSRLRRHNNIGIIKDLRLLKSQFYFSRLSTFVFSWQKRKAFTFGWILCMTYYTLEDTFLDIPLFKVPRQWADKAFIFFH